MLKDFRPMLRKPEQGLLKDDILRQFNEGNFQVGYKLCKRSKLELAEFQEAIETGAKKMYKKRRMGELLSLIYNTGITVQYDTKTLLKAMFKANDYHGFLKQAYRFKMYSGIEKEIEVSIKKLIERRQVTDAEGWRRKFKIFAGLDSEDMMDDVTLFK